MSTDPSRRGELMRLEVADHIRSFLHGEEDGATLIDWAVDHPFFDDRSDLDERDQRIIAAALGRILMIAPDEPSAERTTREELAASIAELAAP